MRKIFLKNDTNYKKKYRILLVEFFILSFVFCAFIYINFDYLLFKILICENYIFTDTLDKLYSEHLQLEPESYGKQFDKLVISVMTDAIAYEDGDVYTYLTLPHQYKAFKEYSKEISAEAEIKELNKDTVYLKIPTMTKYTKKFVLGGKDEMLGYKNIIIDLRSNTGGFLSDSYKIADLFLDKNKTLGYENARKNIFSREVMSKNEAYLEFDNIIILLNNNTASAAETLIMSLMENLDNVTLIGEKSFGKGIGQAEFMLKDGYAVQATVLELKTPSGSSIHRIGIEPDYVYTGGDIIEYTLELAAELP